MEPLDIIDKSLQEGNVVSSEEVLPDAEAGGHITKINEKDRVDSTTIDNQKNRRIVKVPSKLTNYIRNKISDRCPGCRTTVTDGEEGVVCEQCNAYWHYQCAKVTQAEIDTVWKEEFLCEAHRASNKLFSNVPNVGETLHSVTIKINPYSLDKLNKVKFKLSHMEGEMEITPKACKRQHTVKVNSVTYQIIMNNLTNFGHLLGDMEIKRADTDEVGENVQIQYYLSINGSIPVSVTCYHTTNNILIQLRSNKKSKIKSNSKIEESQKQLRQFVNTNFAGLIRHIEASAMYHTMKTQLESALNATKERVEQGHIDSQVKQSFDVPKSTDEDIYATPRGGNTNQLLQLKQSVVPSTPSKTPTPKRKGKQCNEECESTRAALKTRISTLEKEKLCLKQKLDTSEKHQESLRSTISHKESLISTQAQVIADQTKSINNQKKLISDHELQSKTHSEFASSFLEIMVSDGHNMEDTEVSIDSPKILKQMHEKVKDLEAQVLTYQSKLEEEGKMREDFQNKVAEESQKLSTKTKEFNALKNQLASMEDTVLSKEKELRAVHDDAANNQCKNESLSIENARLRAVLTETEKKNDELLVSLENLRQSVPEPGVMEQLLEKNKEKDKEIEQLKENIDFTEKSLEEQLTEKMSAKEKEAQELKETLESTKKSWEDSKALLKKETSKARQAQGLWEKEQERRVFFQEESSSLSIKLAEANVQLDRKKMLIDTYAVTQLDEKATIKGDESVATDDEKKSGPDEAGSAAASYPCIFQLRKTGSCLCKDKCKFDHELSQKIQTNSVDVSELLAETSTRIGRCAFEMTERGSCPGQPTCTINHVKDAKTVNNGSGHQSARTRVCFRELVEEGSCRWGSDKCRFSHKITAEQRGDASYIQAQRKEKDERASKCIHEFRSEGECRNKDRCSFSHRITEEDRNDAVLKESIKERLSVIKNKQERKKEVQNDVDTSGKISEEVATLREELRQMKQLMMSMKNP